MTADEDGPDGFVRVNVVFPGLKKKFLKNAPSNGNVDLKMEERYFKNFYSMIFCRSTWYKLNSEKYFLGKTVEALSTLL